MGDVRRSGRRGGKSSQLSDVGIDVGYGQIGGYEWKVCENWSDGIMGERGEVLGRR